MAQKMFQMHRLQPAFKLGNLQRVQGKSSVQALFDRSGKVTTIIKKYTTSQLTPSKIVNTFRPNSPMLFGDTTTVAPEESSKGCPRCGGAVFQAEEVNVVVYIRKNRRPYCNVWNVFERE